LHVDSINNPSDAEFSVISKTQALGRGRTNPGVARVKCKPRMEQNPGKRVSWSSAPLNRGSLEDSPPPWNCFDSQYLISIVSIIYFLYLCKKKSIRKTDSTNILFTSVCNKYFSFIYNTRQENILTFQKNHFLFFGAWIWKLCQVRKYTRNQSSSIHGMCKH